MTFAQMAAPDPPDPPDPSPNSRITSACSLRCCSFCSQEIKSGNKNYTLDTIDPL
jgi:hypothetical protein